MAGLILKAPYYKHGHKSSTGRQRGNLLEYVATRDGVDLVRGDMVNYIGNRKGSCGLFSDDGVAINLEELSQEITKYQGNVWMLIFSLKRADAERLGYNSSNQWMNLLRSHRNDIAKEMRILPNNLHWYAAYHNNEEHPHVHMMVWSDDPKEAYLSVNGIHNIKRTIAGDIFRQDLFSVYKEQTALRDDIKAQFRQRLRELSVQLNMNTLGISDEFYLKLSVLAERLKHHKGKKVYGYLDKKTKSTVDDIVKIIAKDEKIAEMYELWYQFQCETYRTYTDIMPEKIPLESNKEFKSIRNQIVKMASGIDSSTMKFHFGEYFDYKELKKHADDLPYLEAVAEGGNPMAMYRVGRYHLEKTDDMDEALYWLKKAADNGNAHAMYLMYKGYRDGKFKIGSDDKHKYLRMAVDAEFGYAEYEYAKTEENLTPEAKLDYFTRASEHGCAQATYEIGRHYYENGDTEKAKSCFEEAAEHDLGIRTRLALFYIYTEQDWDKGMEHLKIAVDQGYEPAKEALHAIEKNRDARIVMNILDLFAYASDIIEDEADGYYSEFEYDGVDSKQKRENKAKRDGIIMNY